MGAGDETWRAVSLQFTEDAVWYAMDAEFRRNRVFRLDRATGRRDEIGIVDGPVYYSAQWRGALFFAVAVESCPSQEGRSATLWMVRDARLSRVAGFPKDRWPVRLLPGTLHFPSGPGTDAGLHFSGVAVAGGDDRCFRLDAP